MLLGDQPYEGTNDPLGFDAIVGDLFSLIVASRDSTPFTLGIEAAWGMGKSTLMSRLCARLAEEKTVTPVIFNAWTADDGGVLEGLVKTVLNELDPNVLRRSMRNKKLMSWMRGALTIAGTLVGAGNVVDSVWNVVAHDPRARNELRSLVEGAIAEWREKQPGLSNEKMLCVFVDDLDRCSPQGVLEVFEAMKLYLDVPGIVFVVGYDQDIVSDLVLREKGYSEAIKSRDYLEKFVQIVYRIPRTLPGKTQALVDSLLEDSGTAALFGGTERYLVIEGSQSNPRRIKRFINAFVLAYGLDPRWRKFEPQSLIRIQLLQMYFPDFARLLERPGERDPVAEFLGYQQACEVLRRREGGEAFEKVVAALVTHGLPVPVEDDPLDAAELLGQLNDNVPVVFPALAGRNEFVSLVGSIAEAADWPQLRAALAEGALPAIAPEAQAQRDSGREGALEGLQVLWVDDQPGGNMPVTGQLLNEGAQVTLVLDTDEMKRQLLNHRFDVLVSDIGRPHEPEAGLTAIEELRSSGVQLPPVVFFTGRVTAARARRAVGIGAALTTEPDELLDFLEGVGESREAPETAEAEAKPAPRQSFRLPPPA